MGVSFSDCKGEGHVGVIHDFIKKIKEYHKEPGKVTILKLVLEYKSFTIQRKLTTTLIIG